MKKSKFIISVLLAAVMAFPLAGCRNENTTDDIAGFTDIDLVLNSGSGYKIVIPEESTVTENFAANELRNFIEQATGANLQIVSDNGLSFNEAEKHLSVGKTKIFSGSGVSADISELGRDGFKLVTKGSTVIIIGATEDASVYAVYEFLNQNLGIEIYANDEIYLPKNNSVKLKKFNLTDIPDFQDRATGFYSLKIDKDYRFRMRTGREMDNWALWAHTHFTILPPAKYWENHPDWYSAEINSYNKLPAQLCLTNEEMRAEFVKNTLDIIIASPKANFIMLGQEDYNGFCSCERCKAETAKYKESGVMMRFINAVARDVKQQLAEKEPGRNITLSTFAYQKTQEPPVIKNESTGEYSVTDPSIIAQDNVAVMVAPLYACYSHNMLDKNCNNAVRETLLGWSKVSDNLQMWSYCTNFGTYMVPFNNFSIIQQNYRIFKDLNFKYLFDQGTLDSFAPGFQAYRIYLHSKLMWDTEIDTKKLTKDFFDNYYKTVSEDMAEYYNLLRSHYLTLELDTEIKLHTYPSNTPGMAMINKAYWSKGFLDNCMGIFENAYQKIENAENINQDTRQKLIARVKTESLSTRFLLIELYGDLYNYADRIAMIDAFEADSIETGVANWGELIFNSGKTVANKIADWKSKI